MYSERQSNDAGQLNSCASGVDDGYRTMDNGDIHAMDVERLVARPELEIVASQALFFPSS